jgi:hypothetical protein
MPITYRTGNPPPPPAESLALSSQVAHAIRVIGQDWQEDVQELVRLNRDYRVAEAASPKTAEIARQSN